jgi:hypothetical protein
MKTIFATIAFCTLLASAGNAATDTTRTKKVKATTNQALLTAEEEHLFMNDRLNEKSIQPMYTTVDQVIFTEQIRNVQKKD